MHSEIAAVRGARLVAERGNVASVVVAPTRDRAVAGGAQVDRLSCVRGRVRPVVGAGRLIGTESPLGMSNRTRPHRNHFAVIRGWPLADNGPMLMFARSVPQAWSRFRVRLAHRRPVAAVGGIPWRVLKFAVGIPGDNCRHGG